MEVKTKIQNIPMRIIIGSVVLVIAILFLYAPWKHAQRFPMKYDVAGYYVYLPAIFIQHDFQMNFLKETQSYHPHIGSIGENYFKTENGYASKYPIGLSIMYAPFFLMAYAVAWMGGYPLDGYSTPFQFFLSIHPVLYLFLALLFLYRTYTQYFHSLIVAVSLCLLLFCTHLFFYSTIAANMPHIYLFFWVSILLYSTERWLQQLTFSKFFFSILLCSWMIFYIRPTTCIVCLYPMIRLLNVVHQQTISISAYGRFVSVAFLLFCVGCLPLFLIWKIQSGHWLFYSYRNEGFHFTSPQILQVLVGFRKGWLIYSPFFLLLFLGVIKTYKKYQNMTISIAVVFFLHTYIISSWWCWWYGGSFGMRPMIDLYPFLLFFLLPVFESVWEKRKRFLSYSVGLFILGCFCLNLLQSYQYLKGILVYDGMSVSTYRMIWGKLHLTEAEKKEIEKELLKGRSD